jgi:LTXXQ motif family protein
MKRLTMAAALAVAALASPTWAQSPAEHDSHHPSDSAQSAPVPVNPAPPASQPDVAAPQDGMGNMPMMGMMNDMKNMMKKMGVMQEMGMMGHGMDGMSTIDHIEGRIAFLRTELKVTDAQAAAWNGFADALRANAKKLADVRASMMSGVGGAQAQASTLADRLDLQEKWLLARLDGTRMMKSAFVKLNETLSDDQKKTANDLFAPNMGMGMMAMTASPMSQGQMQPGQMGPGRMQPGKMPGMGKK